MLSQGAGILNLVSTPKNDGIDLAPIKTWLATARENAGEPEPGSLAALVAEVVDEIEVWRRLDGHVFVSEPVLARTIVVTRKGRAFGIEIDGHPFPWFTTTEPKVVIVSRDAQPSLQLTIGADRVEVVNQHAAD
jgi:hypothetical protein